MVAPPTGLTLVPDTTSIDASWTAPAGPAVTGYTVSANGGSAVDVGSVLTYTLTGLTPSTAYSVEVCAYIDTPTTGSLLSVVGSAASTEIVPGGEAARAFNGLTSANQSWVTTSGNSAPSWLRLELATPTAVASYEVTGEAAFMNRAPKTWTWEGSADGSTGWTVLDTVASAPWSGALPLTLTSDTTGSYKFYRMNITAIVTAGPYCSVSELRAWGVGTPTRETSDPATDTTDTTTPPPPDPPTDASATTSSTSATLTWTPPVAGTTPTSYEVRVNGGAPVDVALSVSYAITGLTPETTYTLEVRSVNDAGPSDWASTDATTDEAPPPPDASTDPRAWHIARESRRVEFPTEDRTWPIPAASRNITATVRP